MKFFFPDSQDYVDPSFNFETERRREDRVRIRHDRYAHEVFKRPPFDGLLVSKAIVDGVDASGKSGKYSLGQRHRLLREGVRSFFRLDEFASTRRLLTMGDCGAFSYVREPKPPFSVAEVIEFYQNCRFDLGLSVDHVILGYDESLDGGLPGLNPVPKEYLTRQEITLDLAADFKREHRAVKCTFEPVGVAQGWSPKSYARAVRHLQRMGYTRIALGGMVPLRTPDILAVLERVSEALKPGVQLHLLGVTRTDHVEAFASYGVTSFDTTSPFLRAFKDAKQNYFTADGSYTALRVPQVQGNARLEAMIRAGQVDQRVAMRLEKTCLTQLRLFDRGIATAESVLAPLLEYEELVGNSKAGGKGRRAAYEKTLSDQPWKECACEVCSGIGVEVVIFRGSERNKRRGFHNLFVLYGKLHRKLNQMNRRRSIHGQHVRRTAAGIQ